VRARISLFVPARSPRSKPPSVDARSLNTDFKKTIVMVTHDPRAASRAHVERHLEKGVLAASVERHERVPAEVAR
jgi:hypothetical protein